MSNATNSSEGLERYDRLLEREFENITAIGAGTDRFAVATDDGIHVVDADGVDRIPGTERRSYSDVAVGEKGLLYAVSDGSLVPYTADGTYADEWLPDVEQIVALSEGGLLVVETQQGDVVGIDGSYGRRRFEIDAFPPDSRKVLVAGHDCFLVASGTTAICYDHSRNERFSVTGDEEITACGLCDDFAITAEASDRIVWHDENGNREYETERRLDSIASAGRRYLLGVAGDSIVALGSQGELNSIDQSGRSTVEQTRDTELLAVADEDSGTLQVYRLPSWPSATVEPDTVDGDPAVTVETDNPLPVMVKCSITIERPGGDDEDGLLVRINPQTTDETTLKIPWEVPESADGATDAVTVRVTVENRPDPVLEQTIDTASLLAPKEQAETPEGGPTEIEVESPPETTGRQEPEPESTQCSEEFESPDVRQPPVDISIDIDRIENGDVYVTASVTNRSDRAIDLRRVTPVRPVKLSPVDRIETPTTIGENESRTWTFSVGFRPKQGIEISVETVRQDGAAVSVKESISMPEFTFDVASTLERGGSLPLLSLEMHCESPVPITDSIRVSVPGSLEFDFDADLSTSQRVVIPWYESIFRSDGQAVSAVEVECRHLPRFSSIDLGQYDDQALIRPKPNAADADRVDAPGTDSAAGSVASVSPDPGTRDRGLHVSRNVSTVSGTTDGGEITTDFHPIEDGETIGQGVVVERIQLENDEDTDLSTIDVRSDSSTEGNAPDSTVHESIDSVPAGESVTIVRFHEFFQAGPQRLAPLQVDAPEQESRLPAVSFEVEPADVRTYSQILGGTVIVRAVNDAAKRCRIESVHVDRWGAEETTTFECDAGPVEPGEELEWSGTMPDFDGESSKAIVLVTYSVGEERFERFSLPLVEERIGDIIVSEFPLDVRLEEEGSGYRNRQSIRLRNESDTRVENIELEFDNRASLEVDGLDSGEGKELPLTNGVARRPTYTVSVGCTRAGEQSNITFVFEYASGSGDWDRYLLTDPLTDVEIWSSHIATDWFRR